MKKAAEKITTIEKLTEDGFECLFDSNLIIDFSPIMLTPDYWQKQGKIVGEAFGRGTTYFIEGTKQDWVLRHYFRGGLIGKIIRDSYIFTEIESTRAFKELRLLETLVQHDMPAPKPVACRVKRSGLFYRADLLTTRIESAKDLVGILQQTSIEADVWEDIGKMIKKFHQLGIYHHDLNSHNILLDVNNKSWLIDFDRGEQREIEKTWQQANLARLHRSFDKEKGKLKSFHWSEHDWSSLIAGYES